MRNIIFFIGLFCLIACDDDTAPDCLKTTGKIISGEIELPEFHEIMTYDNVILFVEDQPEQKVVLETGENIFEDIDFKVIDGRLEIKNKNTCNLFRGYKHVKVYVNSPNISSIHNGSAFDVSSLNTLNYEHLSLKTDNYEEKNDYYKNGNFFLDLNTKNVVISSSSMSGYYLNGKSEFIDIQLYGGVQRIEAAGLEVKNAEIYHRGFNEVILNVSDTITGQLLATGDLILVKTPLFIDVEEKYKGKVYIEE